MQHGSSRRDFLNQLSAGAAVSLCLPSIAHAAPQSSEVLFCQIGTKGIAKSTAYLVTAGWNVRGLGAGSYVSDQLAYDLVALHPRFCARAPNGRCYRLFPDNGMITAEQAGAQGDFGGDGQSNDRPAFQAAVDYARAIGIETVGMSQRAYAIWVGERFTDPDVYGADGHGLVTANDQRIQLVGLTAEMSRIRFLSYTGHTFDGEEAGINLQYVNGKPWRGHGIHLRTHSDPNNAKRSLLVLRNLWVDAGLQRNALTDPPEKLAWDVNNKGIYVEADHLGGSVSIFDSALTGWRGETVYCTNDVTQKLTIRNSLFANSNGQGLNPNACQVDVENVKIRNCFVGIEGWTGAKGGRIVGTTIIDCFGKGQSGGAFSLQGGMYRRSARSGYYAPAEVTPGEIPTGQIDITCKRCSHAVAGWWLTGNLNLIDTPFHLGEPCGFDEGSQDLALNISLKNETIGGTYVIISGGAGVRGDMLTDNCALNISVSDAPGYTGPLHPPVMWYGSLGDNINIALSGAERHPAPVAITTAPDFAPHFS